MKKDSETLTIQTNEIFLDNSEENMEEILASIRKIMDSSSQPVVDPKKEEILPSHLTSTATNQAGLSSTPVSGKEDILVLTKKVIPSQKEEKSNVLSSDKYEIKERNSEQFSSKIDRKSSLEALVISSMSPLIETWLERNLSNIVEKVVKDEIKKIFRL